MRRETRDVSNKLQASWSAQGLGMLRLYLGGNRRLHVWTQKVSVPHATALHNHPWDFDSVCLRGRIENYRYIRTDNRHSHNECHLHCGIGAHVRSTPLPVSLDLSKYEQIREGGTYSQTFDEIHETHAAEGTVTVITRRVRDNPDQASVFTSLGHEFISAEPRPATTEEVELAESFISELSPWAADALKRLKEAR